jgi:hypothetical protein
MGQWLTVLAPTHLAQLRTTLRSTTGGACHRDLAEFPSPHNEIFTCFALVLAGRRCLRRKWHSDHLIVHHQWQHSWTGTCKPCLQIPIAPWETHVLLVLGRRCLRPLRLYRHGLDNVFLDHRQHSFWKCACLCAKPPIAPKWEPLAYTFPNRLSSKLPTCLPGLLLVHYCG